MKLLFVHQNFPAQFLHLAPEMQRLGHDVRVLTDAANRNPSPVPLLRYDFKPAPVEPQHTRLGRNYTTMSDRGVTDALGALVKRGLLKSDSPQGKVRFGLPQHAPRFMCPQL